MPYETLEHLDLHTGISELTHRADMETESLQQFALALAKQEQFNIYPSKEKCWTLRPGRAWSSAWTAPRTSDSDEAWAGPLEAWTLKVEYRGETLAHILVCGSEASAPSAWQVLELSAKKLDLTLPPQPRQAPWVASQPVEHDTATPLIRAIASQVEQHIAWALVEGYCV